MAGNNMGSAGTYQRLAERRTKLSNGLEVREVRKLTEPGKQVPILSTNQVREHFGLDGLTEYGTAPVPETVLVVNPAWRDPDAAIRSDAAQLQRCSAQFGSLNLPGALEPARVAR